MIRQTASIASALGRRSARAFIRPSAAMADQTIRSFAVPTKVEYDIIPKSDLGPVEEFSVIFTNRSLNLMAPPFQKVMTDLNSLLKQTYGAAKAVIIPGSGTYGMEATARQFGTNKKCMVIRNGWFSFRWTEIFEFGDIPSETIVHKARPIDPTGDPSNRSYTPIPIDELIESIRTEKPDVLFAPHTETSTGILLSDDYITKAADAMHEIGGLFVLDCVASGTVWADMEKLGHDVVISAPQKGWTGPACAGLVMLSDRASKVMDEGDFGTSFSMSLKKWSAIMDAYEAGGFGYHTTMPTDALRDYHEISVETMEFGMQKLNDAQIELGARAREMFESKGLKSVAGRGFESAGVLVFYSPDGMSNLKILNRFKDHGIQIAMGVPWRIDEPEGLNTFRIGLFGLDKLADIEGTLATMEKAVDHVMADERKAQALKDAMKAGVDPRYAA
mmetsp:Transcript_5040/g.10634  ORF Transcript_5040/g.10634 Transcript_5040/m.10634 type:complete len:446 (+) Transcript_5040:117-1454(+)